MLPKLEKSTRERSEKVEEDKKKGRGGTDAEQCVKKGNKRGGGEQKRAKSEKAKRG